jgi:hypothetical protein
MTISSNGKLLVGATKELMLKWRETRESWQDQKAHEFEQKYLNDLLTIIDRSGSVFDDLGKLVDKVRSDCE